jgi:RNA polymerase sigma-70 factor (ECF subfamily)
VQNHDPIANEAPPGARLAEAFQAAQAAWPGTRLDPDRFAARVAEAFASAHPPTALHLTDLYLAAACESGDRAALALFESHIAPAAQRAAARLHTNPAFVAEVVQRTRERLFVGTGKSGPRIRTYAGQGPLCAWVRAVAARVGLDLLREQPHETTLADDAADLAACDPELEYLRERHGADYRAAFASAVGALLPRQRSMLKLHVLHGLQGAQIAAVFHLSSSRVSELLSAARHQLLDHTRTALAERLGTTESEAQSLIHALRSKIQLSLKRLLT